MKKAVYIITALLTTAFTVCGVLDTITSFDDYHGLSFGSDKAFFWQSIITSFVMLAIFLAFIVLSLMQIKKSTPRIILMFSGAAFFTSFNSMFPFRWLGLLCMAAGLLPALYEFIKYGKLVKNAPRQYQSYNGMLIAAGVLSCISIAFCIYALISNIALYKGFKDEFAANFYYSTAIGVILCICTAVFCFLKYRRTSVLYRMFFIGSSAMSVVLLPVNIAYILLVSATATYTYVDPVRVLGSVVSLTLVLLVLIHTFKTRRDSLIPQEHADAAPQAEISAV